MTVRLLISDIAKSFFALVLSFGLINMTLSPASGEEVTRVKKKDLSCIVEHSEKYLGLNTDPLVIFLDVCPETSIEEAARSPSAKNYALPRVRESEKNVTNVLILSKTELGCLVRQAGNRNLLAVSSEDDVVPLEALGCTGNPRKE